MLDIYLVSATPPKKPGALRVLAVALATLPRMWCSLRHSPMPELREVGHEWRTSGGA